MRARPHDLASPLRSLHPQTRSHPEVPGVRTPAYLCSGDATQPTTPVWSPSVLTGSLRPAAVEGRRKRSQNTRFLTPSSGTCDGHTLWATWRWGPLGKRGAVSPRADALRTPSGPAGKQSSSPTRQPVLGPPQASRGRRRHRVSACGRQPLPVSSLPFAAVAITCHTCEGPSGPHRHGCHPPSSSWCPDAIVG